MLCLKEKDKYGKVALSTYMKYYNPCREGQTEEEQEEYASFFLKKEPVLYPANLPERRIIELKTKTKIQLSQSLWSTKKIEKYVLEKGALRLSVSDREPDIYAALFPMFSSNKEIDAQIIENLLWDIPCLRILSQLFLPKKIIKVRFVCHPFFYRVNGCRNYINTETALDKIKKFRQYFDIENGSTTTWLGNEITSIYAQIDFILLDGGNYKRVKKELKTPKNKWEKYKQIVAKSGWIVIDEIGLQNPPIIPKLVYPHEQNIKETLAINKETLEILKGLKKIKTK